MTHTEHRVSGGCIRDRAYWNERVAANAPSLLFRPGERNRCPGCGHSNWHVGRVTAECGFCGTALTIAPGDGAFELEAA